MIVKMKKITLLLTAASRSKAAKNLRKLGVVHIHDVKTPVSEDLDSMNQQKAVVDKALLLFEDVETVKSVVTDDPQKEADNVLALHDALIHQKAVQENLLSEAVWFDRYGSISQRDIGALQAEGIVVDFYALDKGGFNKLPADVAVKIASEKHGTINFAHIRQETEKSLDLKANPMPDVEYSELMAEIKHNAEKIRATENDFRAKAAYKDSLLEYKLELQKQLEFQTVLDGMGDEEQFLYMQGFCPESEIEDLKKAADKHGWAYLIDDPDRPEDVPTLTSKPGWLKMIDPLFDFMGTVPGYNEYDISFWFLLFFSIFFAMLIGDAGYGLIFLGLTIWASNKFKNVPKAPFYLVYTLSGATVIWGVITGNWFGYAPIGKLPFLNVLVIDQIDSFATGNSTFLMYLCFVIGVIHLSIAHGLKAFKIIKSPQALGEIGWIGVLWSLFFVAGNLVIGKPLPDFMMPLFISSAGLILIFSNFQKNIIKGILTTLGDLPLSIISSFSDVVSYLRLFAVGYASVTVAASFNNMAIGDGITSILAGLTAALVLLLGHGLNIILGLMAVIVHGVRLNMLEFSGQLDMQWAGKPYKPFKE